MTVLRVKPPRFTPRQCLRTRLRRRAGPVEYLAGGTTLIDLMKLDVMRPAKVVDLGALAGAHDVISVAPDGVRLGAMVKMSAAADHPEIVKNYPVVAQSLQLAASAQLRNMATLGGNVLQRTRCPYFRDPTWTACNKRDPGSGCAALDGLNRQHAILGGSPDCIAAYPGDFAQSLIALDATVTVAGSSGVRTIPFAALHRLPGATRSISRSAIGSPMSLLSPPPRWR
jgi:xanthine dehydrogenase YagS FAD-binding subunit